MKAIVVEGPGGIENLVYRDLPEPVAGRGQVVIDTAYAAANWSDIQRRQGVYPYPVTYPAVFGGEISGHIRSVGPGVEGFEPGQPVAAITNEELLGGYAERCAVDAEFLIPLGEDISLRFGAAFPVVSLTAYHILFSAHDLKPDDRILIHAIGGAVGLALTQLAKARGATVIGTVGSAGKGSKALSYGADRVIDRSQEDFVEATRAFTNGQGVDLVIDSLGADILPRSFDALRTYGRVINIGEAAGYPDFDIRPKLYENSTSLAGFELLHARRTPDRWRQGITAVVQAISEGSLEIPIVEVFPFDRIHALHRKLESRSVSGKLLLETTNPAVNSE